ncbi:hypothetical protein JMJ77_0007729, partial [Colletotrichum scovillei]
IVRTRVWPRNRMAFERNAFFICFPLMRRIKDGGYGTQAT